MVVLTTLELFPSNAAVVPFQRLSLLRQIDQDSRLWPPLSIPPQSYCYCQQSPLISAPSMTDIPVKYGFLEHSLPHKTFVLR